MQRLLCTSICLVVACGFAGEGASADGSAADKAAVEAGANRAGVKQLKSMSQLRSLELSGTKVTDAGVKELQAALPNCTTVWNRDAEPARAEEREPHAKGATGDAAQLSDIALRQAEAKYEATLKAAEKQLQEAHEQFRQRVAAARQQFLADIAAARTGTAPSPAPSPSPAQSAEEFKDLPVSVPGHTPVALAESSESVWSEVPAIAQGAVIFVPPGEARKEGVVEFTVQREALIGLAASWAYDGNASGGWQSERKTKQQLADDGWIEVGKMYRGLHDRHTIFFRKCRKGEAFRIRTRKYCEPYVLVPGIRKTPPQPEPRKVDPSVAVEVLGATVQPVVEVLEPGQIRKALMDTQVYDSGLSGVAIVHVHREGPIYVAASWDYDGNSSGQWMEERWLKEDFEKNGWKEIGTVKIPHHGHQQEHTLFARTCNKGERFRLRTRKYGAPYVFVPVSK